MQARRRSARLPAITTAEECLMSTGQDLFTVSVSANQISRLGESFEILSC